MSPGRPRPMLSFLRIERAVVRMADLANGVAAAAVVFIMFLITADVILRFFRHPIPGVYDIVGLTGSAVISFALPYTTLRKGHIAVDFLVQKLPRTARAAINVANTLASLALFALIAWESAAYAAGLRASGEVSPTVQLPTYPFVYGVAAGCSLLCVVLLMELVRQLRGAEVV